MTTYDHVQTATHCFGRHLLDLPSSSTVQSSFVVGGASVEARRGINAGEFSELVEANEKRLRAEPHKTDGSMFRDRIDFRTDRILLSSWFSPNSTATNKDMLYTRMADASVMHVFSVEGSGSNPERAKEYMRRLSRNLSYRATGEVPTAPGFCIDQGLVTLSKLNKEEVTAGIRIRGMPGLSLGFMSYVTGAPDKPLLRRNSRIPPGYEGTAAGMKTLRRGDRNIGPIKGQELLVRGDAGGKRSYEFLWESQGEKASIEHPFLSLRMSTTDETDENGEIMDAPFNDDAEALALWDSILGTLRLRPGAINPGGADLR
ncbi:T6SS immunity protein Tli4 family protein [Lysobacter sp. A03]|uniref:T6SS immunity protein Tli4 family protein n=1 Tax=Lysobacter sp. A03 TaxID=1199154 RepID=UPI000A8F0D69|nr:T6SS immunity protein Tli4 family protein [Lysobacter sp. A03]